LPRHFFTGIWTIAPKSNDPEAVMRTVGVVAGFVDTLGIVMIIFGLMAKGR
jgi:hypothetical protein